MHKLLILLINLMLGMEAMKSTAGFAAIRAQPLVDGCKNAIPRGSGWRSGLQPAQRNLSAQPAPR